MNTYILYVLCYKCLWHDPLQKYAPVLALYLLIVGSASQNYILWTKVSNIAREMVPRCMGSLNTSLCIPC